MKPPSLLLLMFLSLVASRAAAAKRPGPSASGPRAEAADPDTDGYGLPDFQEVHKYRTDPARKDTAGKGTPDGDWQQRREFSYSVRAVLRVMPPYNRKAINDDYQDARVLSETKDYAELRSEEHTSELQSQ